MGFVAIATRDWKEVNTLLISLVRNYQKVSLGIESID